MIRSGFFVYLQLFRLVPLVPPLPRFGVRSTVALRGRRFALSTGMNCPVCASQPNLNVLLLTMIVIVPRHIVLI